MKNIPFKKFSRYPGSITSGKLAVVIRVIILINPSLNV